MDGYETLAVLTRSPVRLRVLRYLTEHGPVTVDELTRQFDVTRRTVSRTVTALENEGLATTDGRAYCATTYADLLAGDLFELLEAVATHRHFATFLDAFPDEAIDADLETADGKTTLRRPSRPHAPVSHVIDVVSDASRITLLAPVATPLYVRPLIARVRDGATVEAVVQRDAYDEFCSQLRGAIRLAGTLADVSLAVHDTVSFGLLQSDDRVVLGAYDDGILQATFETDDAAVRDAARATVRRYRDSADRVVG